MSVRVRVELLLREEHHRVEGGAAEGVAARLEARGVGQQVQVLPHLLVEDGGGELGLREDGHVVHVAQRGQHDHLRHGVRVRARVRVRVRVRARVRVRVRVKG